MNPYGYLNNFVYYLNNKYCFIIYFNKSNFHCFLYSAGDYCHGRSYKKDYRAEQERSKGLENQLRGKQVEIATLQKELLDCFKVIEDQKIELQSVRDKIKILFDTTRYTNRSETITSKAGKPENDDQVAGSSKPSSLIMTDRGQIKVNI